MDLGIAGKRAAVAAASKGLGFGAAAALVAEGVHVAICGRDRLAVDAAVAKLGPNAVGLVADVSTGQGGVDFVEAATAALGGTLDIVVVNAGGPAPGNFARTSLDAYPAALETSLLSVVGMCKAAVPAMRAQKWGRIVAITSLSVRQPMANLILSNTARAGATGFLTTLAREIAGDGVTVNSLQPGSHATDRLKSMTKDLAAAAREVPAGMLGDAADFGAFVAFLCSRHARFVTGTHTPVDGGSNAGLM